MRYLLLLLALCPLAGRAYGQVSERLAVGQRVWVRAARPSGSLDGGVKGTLEGITSDSLRIRPSGDKPAVSVGISEQTQVFAFAGKRSSALRGALIGGGVGVLAGAALGLADGGGCSGFVCFSQGTTMAMGAIGLGGMGLISGLIIGALSPHDTWARAEPGPAVRPIVVSHPRDVGLGLSLAF